MKLLTLDMGNSGLKAALFDGEEITARSSLEYRDSFGAADQLLERFSPEGIALCSVVPSWSGGFIERAAEIGSARIVEVSSGIRLPFRLLVRSPEKLGADRICAAAGARSLGAGEAVIVDCGTACTVDLITARGFEGGAIFPGFGAVLASLSLSAAALPIIESQALKGECSAPPGKSTEEAMTAGAYLGIAGALEKLVKSTACAAGSKPDIFLTGGGADSFRTVLDFPFIYEPDLVFRGLHLIFNYS